MKKLICILVILCVVFPLCYGEELGFKDTIVYALNNGTDWKIKSTLEYLSEDSDTPNLGNHIRIIYYEKQDLILVSISEYDGLTYWYKSNNLIGTIANINSIANAILEYKIFNSCIFITFIDSNKNYPIHMFPYNTKTEIYSDGVFTTTDNFITDVITYGCGTTALVKINTEVSAFK